MLRESHQMKRNKSITSKVIKSDDGQLLMKYGYAYFPLRSIQKSKVSERTRSLLNSYPCWFIKQSLINSKQFVEVSKHIVSADPKEIYVFEEKQQTQQFYKKTKILSSIDGIKFSCLKVLHIMLMKQNNFQEISWLDAPLLQEMYISTQGCFTSIKPLQKSNFKSLIMLNFRNSSENSKMQPRMFDLHNFHRTKFLNCGLLEKNKTKLYIPPGTISICRTDLSNIIYLSKMQIERLTNFHVPHLQLTHNQHHNFAPNAEYPWCPQLQFSQSKIYRALNNRFDNKTVALSIMDYVFGQTYDQNMAEANNPYPVYNNYQAEQDQYEEIDSDLDKNDEENV